MTIRTHVYCNAPDCERKAELVDLFERGALPSGWISVGTGPAVHNYHFCSAACVSLWASELDLSHRNARLNAPLENMKVAYTRPHANPKETT